MVAWAWSELAVNGIEDSPKKESEILIKMFHIIMSYDSLLLDKTQMDGKYCISKINPSFFFPHKRRLHLHPIFLLTR